MKLLKMIALSTLVIGAAQAATLTFNSTATAASAPSALLFAPDIPLFDATLGTLIQVDIEFEGTFEGDFSFENQSDSDGTVSGSASSQFILVGPGLLGNLIVLNPSIPFAGAVPAGTTLDLIDQSATDSGAYSSAAPAVLAAFTGIGNVAFGGTLTQTGAPVLNFSPAQYNQTVGGQAALEVTYTYETGPPNEVPEPATWAFMTGGGLMLLSMARFRKQGQ